MESSPESSDLGVKISELAKQTELSIDTIRFYEKSGLLKEGLHFQRQDNRYRNYSEAAIIRLRLIQQGKRLGFSLSEIAAEIDAYENEQIPTVVKVSKLKQKIELIEKQIIALTQVKAYLYEKIEIVTNSIE